ncbi:MAG: sugar phosphate nucleotidyltransferase [Bacteroidales bacterium]
MKAFIFAAGLGTRLAPFTNTKPKALVEVGGKPMLKILIEKLINAGVNHIIINVHHFADLIINYLKENNFGIRIDISDERDFLLNTGGGLLNIQKFIDKNENFIVHNVDIYSEIDLKDFFNTHLKNNTVCTLAVSHRNSTNYLLFDDDLNLCGWKSYKTNSSIISRPNYIDEQAFSGIYAFNYEIFSLFKSQEKSFPIIPELLRISEHYDIKAYNHDKQFMLDLGKPEAILQLESYLKNQNI